MAVHAGLLPRRRGGLPPGDYIRGAGGDCVGAPILDGRDAENEDAHTFCDTEYLALDIETNLGHAKVNWWALGKPSSSGTASLRTRRRSAEASCSATPAEPGRGGAALCASGLFWWITDIRVCDCVLFAHVINHTVFVSVCTAHINMIEQ